MDEFADESAGGSGPGSGSPVSAGRSLATAELGAVPALPPPHLGPGALPAPTAVLDVTKPPAPAVSVKPVVPAIPDRPSVPESPAAAVFVSGAATRAGGSANEDFHLVGDLLASVADGVGGEAAGEVASAVALATIAALRPARRVDLAVALEEAVLAANAAVLERARTDARLDGMATTVDVLVVRPDGRRRTAVVAHVGDGTVWHRGSGTPCVAITRPHAIDGGPLLRAVGQAADLVVETIAIPLSVRDRFVLATDGLTEKLTPEDIAAEIDGMTALGPTDAAAALLALAVGAGTRDDTTVVVVDVG
ncbi:PP2C family serine/threonine-protein phosphatase [Parafrankia sp. EUN1f]|uniref:PP2C family protein-serine/threonine phosphatase n=1 Tax=Parafrankia sp. EUN1f TaxID=102897 RepID=UPI0012FBC2B6|nr:protein phosphatase 2C domain-containing protein [Parafrankia sp. EUN1f]